MIVISEDLALAEDLDIPLSHPVIGWQNVVTVDNLVTDTEEADYPASNLANPQTSSKWVGVVGSPETDEYIEITPGTADDMDYIAVVGHNWGTAAIAVSVEILGPDSPDDWQEALSAMIPGDDSPLMFRFTPQPVTAIRLRLQPGDAAPEAAVVYVGKLLVFERGVQGDYTPLPYGRVANVVSGRAESGDYLGRIVTNERTTTDARFIGLTPSWVREHIVPFLEVVATRPFFFAWAPEDFPLEVGFAWANNDPQPRFTLDGWTDFDLQMTGVVS